VRLSLPLRTLIVACILSCCVSSVRGDVLYTQPPDFPPNGFNGFTSVRTPAGGTFTTYDNFRLTQDSAITGITWQGLYWDFAVTADNPPTPNTTSFEADFFADNGGSPGALLSSQTLANVSSQFVSQAFFGPDNNGVNDLVNVLSFHGTLPQPFVAPGGQPLWLSILSNSTSFPPAWIWDSGTGGDGLSFQFSFFSGTGNAVARDRAFDLEGNLVSVPEPGSAALFTFGIVGLTAFVQRRQRRS
jgi:hypothetical protein